MDTVTALKAVLAVSNTLLFGMSNYRQFQQDLIRSAVNNGMITEEDKAHMDKMLDQYEQDALDRIKQES